MYFCHCFKNIIFKNFLIQENLQPLFADDEEEAEEEKFVEEFQPEPAVEELALENFR